MATAAAKDPGPFEQLQAKFDEFYSKAPPAVQVALITLGGATQGGVLGGVLGSLSQNPNQAANNPMLAASTMSGGPLVQARNFAVLTGVNAGLSAVIKRARGGVDDVKGAMGASFGSGVAFSLVSGMGKPAAGAPPGAPAAGPLTTAAITGITFALFNGLFYKIGEAFTGDNKAETGPDGVDRYMRTKYMLGNLGLTQYEKNFKKGQLDDATLMLVNEGALRDCKIPPGPRLLIMHHLDGYRNILKPGAAFPMPPPPPAAPTVQK